MFKQHEYEMITFGFSPVCCLNIEKLNYNKKLLAREAPDHHFYQAYFVSVFIYFSVNPVLYTSSELLNT